MEQAANNKNAIKRALHFDFHTMPGIYDFNREWDAAAFARQLEDAHVTFINLFAQCNLGFSYYPTKIGIPYPGMKGDMFGDALRECQKRGIRVVAYINAGLNHELALKQPGWLRLDKEGRTIRGNRDLNFFRTMCFNTGYREYVLSTVSEIKKLYPTIDGLFTDCLVLEPCYCPRCTDDMLARGIDLKDDQACVDFAHEVLLDVSRDFRKAIGPDIFYTANGMNYFEVKDIQKHIEIECLTNGGWGYDSFPKLAAYARNIQDTVVYMTGRFQASWGDFGGYKTVAAIENDLYDAISNGCQLSVGDHIHPSELAERDVIRDIGIIYKRLERFEQWTDSARYLPEIGVLADCSRDWWMNGSYSGIARVFGELKYNFDILDVRDEAQDYTRFACIVLPDDIRLNEKLAKKIRSYIKNGGKIISTGFSGLKPDGSGFALPEWDFEFCGKDPSDSSYYTFTSLPAGSANMRWSMYKEGIVMKARADGEILADHWKPYFNHGWDGRHGYFYTPPEKKTGEHAAVISGSVAHICFKIFEAYFAHGLREHKRLISQILDRFLPQKLIKTEKFASTARVTATGNDTYTLLHCKVSYPELKGCIGIVEEHNIQPAGATVSLRGTYRSACLLPSETKIRTEVKDGYTKVVLPEFEGFQMLRFDK